MLKTAFLATGALLGLIGAASAQPQPATLNVPSVFKPAQREGYFFVGGQYVSVGGKEIATAHMFVQYHAPRAGHPALPSRAAARHRADWRQLPRHADGRPGGWIVSSSAALRSTSSIRSDADARVTTQEAYGPYARLATGDLESIFTGQERFDLFPQARLHTQWPGGAGVKGNAAFDQFYLSQVPYIASA